MKIRNETLWRTADLKRIVDRIAKEEFPDERVRARLRMRIVYCRAPYYCSGHASYTNFTSTIRVPHPRSKSRHNVKPGAPVQFPNLDFAHVVGHELAHNRGVRHQQMGMQYKRGDYSDRYYWWAKEIPVRVQGGQRKLGTDQKRAARLKTAQAAVVRYQRRLKLDQTLLKKWQRKVRALERLVADTSRDIPEAEAACPVVELPAPCDNTAEGGERHNG